ncbi:MAG TPA: Fe2+-dependent dioxygenase [Pseudomonadaceae bacterium]|nr:Fe2+-dependent dioxygenase [Pseudomonadaceae bacterium]
MLIKIPKVLEAEALAIIQRELQQAQWQDGRGSAGYMARSVKHNQQLADQDPVGRKCGEVILRALQNNPSFTAAALPAKILPPLFNRYEGAQTYGRHIDGAIRPFAGTALRVRTDLSATLFLNEPDSYEGGELVIEDTYGPRRVKLEAGSMVLYPGTSVHHVEPVTKGVRLASFFWIQSMVREDHKRAILLELDRSIQKIATDTPEQDALVDLAGVYHNLLRIWADV